MNAPGAKYPVFSSQTLNHGIMGYLLTYDFDSPQLTWTTDGANAGTVFLRTGKYSCTNICGVLNPLASAFVSLEYFCYSLGYTCDFHKRRDTNGYKIMSNEMAGIHVLLPPLEEQIAIGIRLNQQTAEIDGLIAKLEREVGLLEQYRRELIAHTVTRGLDPDVPMKDSGIDWAGDIPKTWRTQPFVALFSIEKKINSDLRIRNALQFRNGEIVVKPGWDPEDRRLDETLATYKVVTPGMIVINGLNLNYDFKTKRIGLVTQNGVITSAYITLSVKPGIDERFISYLLKSMDSRLLFHGMTEGVRKILSWTDIRREKIPVPPLQEQTEIADYLEGKSAQIDSTIERINKQIELLGKYRKQVINDLVTGKVRVGEVA